MSNQSSLLLLVLSLLAHSCYSKQLVLFAGPHKCAASSVERFFHNHASGYNGAKTSEGLEGWIWPPIQGQLIDDDDSWQRHKVFNFLVTEAENTKLQMKLLKGIKKAWDKSTLGIVVGSEEFDRVGENPDTHYDGLKAMHSVVDELGLHSSPGHVTVVLNYRTPRIDQWVYIWKHSSVEYYHKFLCSGTHSDERWELLDTAMNPLRLATEYRKQGWNVVLIDMGGAMDDNLDVAHVLSCEVLGEVDCKDGWVSDKVDKTYHENSLDKEFNGLYDSGKNDLEQLLRERDCYYESILREDGGFVVLHEDTIWQGCLPENQDLYEQLTNTTNLFNAIRSQKGCSEEKVKVDGYLVGDVDSMTAHNHHDTKVESVEEEGFEMTGEEPLMSKRSKSEDAPLTTSLFLLIAVCAGMYQLYVMHNTREERPPNNEHNPVREQELDAMPSDFTCGREPQRMDQIDSEYGETPEPS
jgi:hypothetical protein